MESEDIYMKSKSYLVKEAAKIVSSETTKEAVWHTYNVYSDGAIDGMLAGTLIGALAAIGAIGFYKLNSKVTNKIIEKVE